jgi:hypothetical protein
MIRTIIVGVLIGVGTTGCATLGGESIAANYCLVGTGSSCSSLEGAGDCQPCPKTVAAAASVSASSPDDLNRAR